MALRKPSAGLYYIFCDEKNLSQPEMLSIGVILVPQQNWSQLDCEYQKLQRPKKLTRIERLKHVLEAVDGVGLVGWAEISEISNTGHRDDSSDISGMARADNIWGFAMATSIYRTLISARAIDIEVNTADIHYDTFDLRDDHRKALHAALHDRIPVDIRKAREDGHAPLDFKPHVRRIEDTRKPNAESDPTKFQIGVMMAHVLLQQTLQLKAKGSAGRIFVVNNSAIITNFIKRFFNNG